MGTSPQQDWAVSDWQYRAYRDPKLPTVDSSIVYGMFFKAQQSWPDPPQQVL